MNSTQTVALFSLGDMGVALAKILLARGITVVSTLRGRSEATKRRAESTGVQILPSLDEALSRADIVLSVVKPADALALVKSCVDCRAFREKRPLFVELNTITPAEMARIEEALAPVEVTLLEGIVTGTATVLAQTGVICVRGEGSERIVKLFEGGMSVRTLDTKRGSVKLLKLLQGGIAKSIAALYAELAVAAEDQGILPELDDLIQLLYPGLLPGVSRMLPTYGEHHARRLIEMQDCATTLQALGFESAMIAGSIRAHQRFSEAGFAGITGQSARHEVVRSLLADSFAKMKT